PPPPHYTPCPYTTLFRSLQPLRRHRADGGPDCPRRGRSARRTGTGPYPAASIAGVGSDGAGRAAERTALRRTGGSGAMRWTDHGDRKSTRLNSSHVKISY